jgi:hypothetical protein
MRHMPCFWTDSLPFPRYWPLGLSFLYFQDNSIEAPVITARVNWPPIAPVVKTLKLAIYLFLEF